MQAVTSLSVRAVQACKGRRTIDLLKSRSFDDVVVCDYGVINNDKAALPYSYFGTTCPSTERLARWGVQKLCLGNMLVSSGKTQKSTRKAKEVIG